MALSIGTLVGYLQLDDTNFDRKADNADRKMEALKLHLQALSKANPKVDVNVRTNTKKLDELQAKIAFIKAESAKGTDMRVDMVSTLLQLDAVQAKVREIGRAAAQDEQQVGRAQKALDALGKVKGPSMLTTVLLGLSPMLATVGGAGVWAMGAISSGALGAVASVGVLKLALSGLSNSIAAYKTYETAMANATTPAQRKAAQTALNKSAYGTSTPEAQTFTRFYAGAWSKFDTGLQRSAQSAVLPGVTQGMRDLISLGPVLDRSVGRVGTALGDLAAKGGKALASPFWRQWFAWLGTAAAKDVTLLGDAFGNFAQGTARALERLSPDGQSLMLWLDSLAKRFNGWTEGDKFAMFLTSVRADAGQVGTFLRDAGPAVAAIAKGFAGMGSVEVGALGDLFATIDKIDPAVLTALGAALPPIILGWKAMSIVGPLGKNVAAFTKVLWPAVAAEEALGAASLSTSTKLQSWGAKAGLAAGGVFTLYQGMTQAHSAMGVMQDAMGGAAIGAMFGPWGAVVGGATGALAGLVQGLFTTKQAFQASLPPIDAWVQAIQTAGAAGQDEQRSLILGIMQDPKNKGALAEAQKMLHMSVPEVLNSVQHGNITAQVGMALGHTSNQLDAAKKALNDYVNAHPFLASPGSGAEADRLQANIDALTKKAQGLQDLQTTLTGINGQFIDASEKAWVATQSTTKYAAALAKLPPQVQTQISALQIQPTTEAVINLAKQYHATPKEVQTYLQALGVNDSIKQIEALIRASNAVPVHKTVSVQVNASQAQAAIDALKHALQGGLGTAVFGIPVKAGKTPAHALGTNYFAGGWTTINENGPELVNLPRGTQIVNAAKTKAMLNGQSRAADGGKTELGTDTLRSLARMIASEMRGAATSVVYDELEFRGF